MVRYHSILKLHIIALRILHDHCDVLSGQVNLVCNNVERSNSCKLIIVTKNCVPRLNTSTSGQSWETTARQLRLRKGLSPNFPACPILGIVWQVYLAEICQTH